VLLVFCFGLGLYAMKSSIAPAIMSELSSIGGEQREINMATWVPIKEYRDLRFEHVEAVSLKSRSTGLRYATPSDLRPSWS
jgi:hypothetical protein